MTHTRYPRVSIIIPLKKCNPLLDECLRCCQELEYPDYEVIILPDNEERRSFDSVKVIPTGPIGPSPKRDIGVKHATGEILAFIDDDTYPAKGWLKAAVVHFDNPEVAAVCGPAVTPDSDTLRQKASGAIFSSRLASGQYTYRYLQSRTRDVDDYPSCNFIVRRSIFEQVGGFDSIYWPGEDTVICLKITRDIRKRIIYDPDVLIYHHRRKLFLPHLRQVWNYAMHRGYFVKRFPDTSLRFSYFVPSAFIVALITGVVLSLVSKSVFYIYITSLFLYALICVTEAIRTAGFKASPIAFPGLILTHLTYGVGFVLGLLVRSLPEEKK